MTPSNPRRFSVCSMLEDGSLRIHFTSDSYDQADLKLEYYSEMFPNALVDIYKRDVLLNCVIAD